ncbi:hypothetical protein NQ317_006164 [Molorchus minor]|uniref:Glucuronosyltransferase n=1 Tax=Molorchus minor TaxID=1323400 RepID=A0ABQ9J8V6_9CUCU|nr:hypothetical protein NQ317_006164 [Molorchus minor]
MFKVILVSSLVSFVYGANILAIIPTPSYSHQIAFTSIWTELSLRGHQVTVITTDPVNDPKLVNLTEINVKFSYKYFSNISKQAERELSMWTMHEFVTTVTGPMIEEQLSYQPVQALMNGEKHFDVVLVEQFYPELLAFAEIYNCPKILVSSLESMEHIHNVIGNPIHPALHPEMGSIFYGKLTLSERVISAIYSFYVTYYYSSTAYPRKERIMHKYFNTSISLVDLLRDIDLLLLNVNPIIQGVRAVGPTTVNFGGFRPAEASSTPLPKVSLLGGEIGKTCFEGIAFTSIWRELSLRGHQVTVITTDPVNDPKLVNLTEINVKWSYKYFTNISKMAERDSSMWTVFSLFYEMTYPMIENQLSYPPVQELIHAKKHFEVVLVEQFYPEFLAFAEIYDCPKILVSSMDSIGYIHQVMGNPTHPVLYPEIGSSFHGKLTLSQRIISTIYNWYVTSYLVNEAYPRKEGVMHKYFNTTRSLIDLIHDTDLMLLNVNPIIQGIRAVGPTTINFVMFKVILVSSLVSFVYGANILAIIPTPSYSHQIAFTPIWTELSLRGHQVTVITTDPTNDPKLVNLTEISVRWSYKYFANISKDAERDTSMWTVHKWFSDLTDPMTDEQLSYPPVRELVHGKKHFDVVLVEHFYPEFLGFAEVYNCPKIIIGSLDTIVYIHQVMGNPTHPVMYPEMGSLFYGNLTLSERILSSIFNWYVPIYYANRSYPKKERTMHKHFNTTRSLIDLIHGTDLILLNVNPVVQGVRAVGPTTINFGYFKPINVSSTPLPKELKQFLDSAKDGFIYFSLGSNVKSKELSEPSLKAIMGALSELPYKVLWKFEADSLPGKPKNVKLIKWAPQQQILSHANIKLFVTQGGLQSMEEGIYSEVPFVVIPFFGDQSQNARLMEHRGIAKIVGRHPNIDKDELKDTILEVLQNPKYRAAVKELKEVAMDTPATGIDTAIWWIEYVIRHKGAKHLRNPAADLPLYQYLLLDVIVVRCMMFKVILVSSLVSFAVGANILAIIPTPSYSHQIAFTSIWTELSLRGHQVTVITTDPVNDPKLVNLTEINVNWSYEYYTNISKMAERDSSMWTIFSLFYEMTDPIIEKQLSYPPVQELIHAKKHFEVVLVEEFFPEFLGFAEIYDCPKILVSSMDSIGYIHQVMGNPTHPVLNPEIASSFHGKLTLSQRIISTIYNWYVTSYLVNEAYPRQEGVMHKYFNTTRSLIDIIQDTNLMLLNVNPIIQGVRAVGPTTINFGGFRTTNISSTTLSKELKQFLDSAKDGFIYFSLGSNVKSKELSEPSLKAITGALSELPYKVLWKFEADSLPGKPKNVKLIKWAPQQQILSHANIKLFVTQGGLQSMEEGIYSEVPFVVIPFFGDQSQNARVMEHKGIAKIVGRHPNIDKDELKDAILEVLQNPKYRAAVKELKEVAMDTPATGIDTAIWWIEYVIRHKGAKHLRNPAADLPLYQYLLLDVIGVLMVLDQFYRARDKEAEKTVNMI